MLKWYKKLYVGNTARKKERRIRRGIQRQKITRNIYVVVLAANPANQLEIFSANELLKSHIQKRCTLVVGLAVGYVEALEIVQQIAEEVWENTGTARIRSWILENQER